MSFAQEGRTAAEAIEISSDSSVQSSNDEIHSSDSGQGKVSGVKDEMTKNLGSKALDIFKDTIKFQAATRREGQTPTDIEYHTRDLMYAARLMVIETLPGGDKLCNDAGWKDRKMKQHHQCRCKRMCTCGGSYWY